MYAIGTIAYLTFVNLGRKLLWLGAIAYLTMGR